MEPEKSYLFVSYARVDLEIVRPLLDELRKQLKARGLPLDIWVDISNLQPGVKWDKEIAEALRSSIGFLFFVSPASLVSDWIREELVFAAESMERLIIPIFLHPIQNLSNLPRALARRHGIDLSGDQTHERILDTAIKICRVTAAFLQNTPQPKAVVSAARAPALAADIAQQVRTLGAPVTPGERPTSVFVVYGHNEDSLTKLEEYLSDVGVEAIILSRRDELPQSLFQKFMAVAGQARFAIVLLSADDYGASRRQYEAQNVADRALQFRARQNVILELGFFYGLLGWESVFVLYQEPDRVFPNFERPSDLDGVIFESILNPKWRKILSAKLSTARFKLSS